MAPRTRKAKKAGAAAPALDRISALPDELLHRILSFLPAQQATQTCVLARRWVPIWKSVTGLRIVGADGKAAAKLPDIREFVDHLFLLRGTSPLEECEFRLVSNADVARIYLWIRHALTLQVRVLRLSFSATFGPRQPPFVSRHLMMLELRRVAFVDQFLDFSRCPSLQDLHIAESGFNDVEKISSQSIKHLKIVDCGFGDEYGGTDPRTLIHAPSLVSLQLQISSGFTPVLDTMPLLRGAAVKLCSSCLDVYCCFDEYETCCEETCKDCFPDHGSCMLLQGLSQAKNLCLISHVPTFIFRRDLKWCPTFEQLKTVVLNEYWFVPDVRALVCFLEHAPVLEEVSLLFSKGPKYNVEMKGTFNPKELPSTISAHLKSIEVKCESVGQTVVEVLRFLSKLNICFSFKENF